MDGKEQMMILQILSCCNNNVDCILQNVDVYYVNANILFTWA